MNNIPSVDQMEPGNDYHLFKEGIQPAWEDPKNKFGGSFKIHCDAKKAEKLWLNIVKI